MGQSLELMQTCNGAGQEDLKAGRGRASSDEVVRDGSGGTSESPGGGFGSSGGQIEDPVVLNRRLSREKYQESVRQAREWQQQIRKENRELDRDIEKIRREEAKLKREIQMMASKGQTQNVKILAKQLVKSRHAVSRMERTKCSMNALQLNLTSSIASASSAGALKMSADMMKEINQVMNVPELQKTLQEMKAETGKAEMADELMEDGFNESDDELEADSEVQKVFDELALDTSFLLAKNGPVARPATPCVPASFNRGGSAASSGDPLYSRLNALQA